MRRGPRFQNELIIAAMGDSTTEARPTEGLTYPYMVAKKKGYGRWINRGISGQTTTQMAARFAADILSSRPGAISIMGGVNDLSTNISGPTWVGGGIPATGVGSTKENYRSMIQAGKAIGARVTVMTFCPVRIAVYLANDDAYLAAIAAVASEEDTEFLDVYSAFSALTSEQWDPLYKPGDPTHPNQAGHAFIAALADSNPNAWAQP